MSKSDLDLTRIMAMGHSGGKIVAAGVTAKAPAVMHIALLGCGGVTQLFSLAELARVDGPAGQEEAAVSENF